MNALPQSKATPRLVAVVVQTHWDREWYFPHQRFVARLLAVMERVAAQLESGKLKYFLFDGQTAAFEDLIEHAEPALADRVRKLVRDKRIILGPWYVMADEFLASGEALLRNLEMGIADATAAGNCQRVGYLPDTFGHIAQMPQLLRAFGITSAVMWRGVDSPYAEFEWRSPDGSSVGTVFLTQGYYQHPLNVDDWQAALLNYLSQIAPRSLSNELLLTQGGDHLLPVDSMAERMDAFNAQQTHYQLHERSLAEHVTTVLAETMDRRAIISGELRANAQAFVLPDVLSTRRYLKRLNQAAEDKLLGQIEPMLAQLNLDTPYPTRYLEKCWRIVIQQQAHDSICGCSVDEVHREMLTRYAQLEQRCDALIERITASAGMTENAEHAGGQVSVFADDERFTLFNPLPKKHSGYVTCKLFFRDGRREGLTIRTVSGAKLPCEVLSTTAHAIFRSPLDEFPDRFPGYLYEIAIQCEIAGLSALACIAEWGSDRGQAKQVPANESTERSIENTQLRIVLDDAGDLVLEDKTARMLTRVLMSIATELDAGDSYNFSPLPKQNVVQQTKFRLAELVHREYVQEMVLQISMDVPASLSADRSGAASERVTNEGTLRLRLYGGKYGENTLDCQLTWTNRAMDQRTRLLMPISPGVDVTYSDAAFDWVERPVMHAAYPKEISRREMPVAVNPSYSAIAAGNITFCHRAMQEYEVVRIAGQDFLGVTLIRSVGWMSRRDLVTRGVGAGPDMATPESQCLGTEIFEFQISLLHDESSTHALARAERFRRPPFMLRGHTHKWRESIDLGNDAITVSAVRCVADDVEIRVWNPNTSAQTIAADGWRRVDADGSPSPLPASVVAPFAIATLRRAR
jgi:mannosylglycerate hydrolase